jgi:hypothetical protein
MTNPLAQDRDSILAETDHLWNDLRDSRLFITGGINDRLAGASELIHRLPFQDAIVALEQIENVPVEHKKARADPSLGLGLLAERLDLPSRRRVPWPPQTANQLRSDGVSDLDLLAHPQLMPVERVAKC